MDTSTKLLGSAEPRLWVPRFDGPTRGDDAIAFARDKLGVELMPHQELILRAGLAYDSRTGKYRFRTVIVLMARQSGKTRTLQVLTLWRLFATDARLVVGTSANIDTALECFRGAVELAQDAQLPIESVRWANGQQALTTKTGARYKIVASNRTAARGLSSDLAAMDELREHRDWSAWNAVSKTTTARENGQRWCFSSGGDNGSVVLNALRERALAGGPDSDILILEWSAPDGADLTDPNAWIAANPALGRTVPVEAIRGDLATDPPETFRVEVLGQRVVALDALVDADAWAECADPSGSLSEYRGKVTAAIDVSDDMTHVSLVVSALLSDDRVRVETAGEWNSPQEARKGLQELLGRVKPRALYLAPGPASATLTTDLKGFRPKTPTTAQLADACSAFVEAANARQLTHGNDPMMSSHVLNAQRQPSGDGFRFRRASGNVDAAIAAALAFHATRQQPTSRHRRILGPKARAA